MPDRIHGSLTKDAEINEASWVAARGATVGAAKWGIYAAVAGAAAYHFSPIFRGLTFQFKFFLGMSAMVMGGMIEADSRMRAHEVVVRQQKRMARDAAVWRSYEADFHGTTPTRDIQNRE